MTKALVKFRKLEAGRYALGDFVVQLEGRGWLVYRSGARVAPREGARPFERLGQAKVWVVMRLLDESPYLAEIRASGRIGNR